MEFPPIVAKTHLHLSLILIGLCHVDHYLLESMYTEYYKHYHEVCPSVKRVRNEWLFDNITFYTHLRMNLESMIFGICKS